MESDNEKNWDDTEQYITTHYCLSEEVEDVEPPLPGFKSRFKSLKEWLTSICENEKPDKVVDTYNFGLFVGEGEYTLFMVGFKINEVSDFHTQSLIAFSPADMYFSLPPIKYIGLERDQVYASLTLELKEFTKSTKYKNSFFHEAKQVKTEWNGEILS